MKNGRLKTEKASHSLHTQPIACVATPHTLPVNHAELQNQRVGCVRYARSCLIDSLPFQQSFKTLNNKLFLLQHPNHKQKSYGALSQKLHCRRHILFHRQTRRPKIAPACRTYRLRVRLIWMCKNNIPLKPSPYAYCRTIFTPFGRCRPTMRIIPCAGG